MIIKYHILHKLESLVKAKPKPIRDIEFDAFRMPYWITDDNVILLNVTEKCITDTTFKQGHLYTTHIEFIAYAFETDDGDFMQGMYCRLPKCNQLEITVDIENHDNSY